jgi:hypothetical protein
MTDQFRMLKHPADNPEGYCTVDQLEGLDDKEPLRQGLSLAGNPPDKLTMSMYADEPRNTVLPDYVQNLDRLLIVSPRLRVFLEAQQVGNVEYYPMEIRDHKGKVASDEYFIAHIMNLVDCIDVEASGVTWTGKGLATQRILVMRTLVLDPARVPEDRKLFFPRYYKRYPVVRLEFAEALAKGGFSNLKIAPVSK